jgi:hypothetical protein
LNFLALEELPFTIVITELPLEEFPEELLLTILFHVDCSSAGASIWPCHSDSSITQQSRTESVEAKMV